MPAESEHILFNLSVVLLPIIFVGTALYWFNQIRILSYFWLFMIAYIIATCLFSPDLDTKSKTYMRWGKLSFIWLLYRKLTKHRGVSHKHLIGTVTKMIYLGFILSPIIVAYLLIPDVPFSFSAHWEYVLTCFIGILVADSMHILYDKMKPHKKKEAKKAP
jgi:uncharacterized metal-binding protein